MTNGIAFLFTHIKTNIAKLRGITLSDYGDSAENSSVYNRAALICALDILLHAHRKEFGNRFNELKGKQALHHMLLLKYKWPLSVIRELTLSDVALALQDELKMEALPGGAGDYLLQVVGSHYSINFPDYLDDEWDPDLSEKYLIEIER